MRGILLDRLRRLGLRKAMRVYGPVLAGYVARLPQWVLFRLMNLPLLSDDPIEEPHGREVQKALERKEATLRALLAEYKGRRFLEIGIGEFPRVERVNLMVASGISYTGCDLEKVCVAHALELRLAGVEMSRVRFESNAVGTYAWTLFEMVERGEKFDFIYLDGHHTFYVDLPAFELAHDLLRPGGHLMVDDIQWTLLLLKKNMARRFTTWYFYKDVYDFSVYTQAQIAQPHLKRIAEHLLLGKYRYALVKELSSEWWWVLRKPSLDRLSDRLSPQAQ